MANQGLKMIMHLLLVGIILMYAESRVQDGKLTDKYSKLFHPELGNSRRIMTSPKNVDSNCKCGQVGSGRTDDDKIINGVEVLPNYKYPWMALLKRNGIYICGGSLINDRFILTAAHCVKDRNPDIYEVVLGIHNISVLQSSDSTENQPYAKLFGVEKVKVHGRYSGTVEDSPFDIALLKLNSSVNFTDQIRPVCLPDYEPEYSQPTRDSVVMGWGVTENKKPSTVLKEATVLVYGPSECRIQSKYGSKITNEMICASASGKDSCQGDSGGPLVVRNGPSYVQLGIVSWGFGCALAGYPGVYASVPSLISFIYTGTKSARYCGASR